MPTSALEQPYQRLTRARPRSGFGVALIARSSLWLGHDHLLCVDSTGYAETYKRLHFQDIQAFLIYRTETWKYRALVMGVLAGLFTLFAVVTGDTVGRSILGTMAAVFYLGLAVELAAGPSCVCRVRTAVQTEELPSLNRIRRAKKVIQRIRPLIAAAQGQVLPADIPTRLREWEL